MPITGPRYVNPSDPTDERTYGAHNLIRRPLPNRLVYHDAGAQPEWWTWEGDEKVPVQIVEIT